MKSSGSAFENFHTDEYTTLKPASDRIFSTAVDASYTLASPPSSLLTLSGLGQLGSLFDYSTITQSVRSATIETFALDESASVQATLYKTAEKVLAENKDIVDITYRMPNKHYIPVDMEYFHGTKNVSPPQVAEVFTPVDAPRYVDALCSLFIP